MRALRLLLLSAAVLALPWSAAAAAGSARSSYERALARERAIAAQGAATTTVSDLRRLLASFERIPRTYPTSGYADNALQKAAQVAEQIYARTHADADRQKAVRLYDWLAREYPASSLARAARDSARALAAARRAPGPTSPGTGERPAPVATPAATALPAPAAAGAADGGRASTRTTPRGVAAPVDRSPPPPSAAAPAPPAEAAPSPPPSPATPSGHPAPASASPPSAAAQLREVRRAVLPEVVRITLELDAEVSYHHERLEGPPRLFFDLKGAAPAPHLRDTVLSWSGDVVRKVRLGHPESGTTRVVLDLEGTRRYSVFTLYNPYRLVIDLERAQGPRPGLRPSAPPPTVIADVQPAPMPPAVSRTPAPFADIDLEPAPPAPPVDPREIDGRDLRLLEEAPVTSRMMAAPSAPPVAAPAVAAQDATPAPAARPVSGAAREVTPAAAPPPAPAVPRPPAANASGGFSLSRQLGLGVSRIVIDPGHGGRDPGAQGQGLSEAELVLDVALRLERLLARQPGVEVVLTRRTDTYVPLEERTAIANREQADLFLSIHANASRNRNAHGVETYFLNFATSKDAEAVAARENSASDRTMHSLPDIVKAIATNNKLHESRDLAGHVQESMVRKLSTRARPARDLGVKQAPFVVLIGAAMPSVLAEISFVTNPGEAQLLKSGGHRQRIAEALHDALVKYQRSLKAQGTVAERP